MEHIQAMYYPPEESFKSLSREEQIREYIKSFKEPALEVCIQLKEHFIAGRYSSIFGVDTSGRLPAVLVHRFAKAVTSKYGLPAIPCHFMPPVMESEREKEITKILQNETNGKHVLVVDDTIMKAQSLLQATSVFRDTDTHFDIAVFIAYNMESDRLKIEADYMGAEKVFIGAEDFVTDGFDDGESPKNPNKISSVNGVERIKGPLHFGGKETVVLGNEDFQDEVNIARTTLFELADEIAANLLR